MDVFVSVLCTFITYFGICALVHNIVFDKLYDILPISAVATLLAFLMLKTNRRTIRYIRAKDILIIMASALLKTVLLLTMLFMIIILFPDWSILLERHLLVCFFLDTMLTIIALLGIRMLMITLYESLHKIIRKTGKRILIYGIDFKSVALEMRFRGSNTYKVAGFCSFDSNYKRYKISGLSVYVLRDEKEFDNLVEREKITGILFATDSDLKMEQDRLLKYCQRNRIKALIAPNISSDLENNTFQNVIRKIRIEDILGRDVIDINYTKLTDNFKDKTVLVTGASGSIGSEICRQLARINVSQLILFDFAETPLHNIRLELESKYPELNFIPIVGDVRVKSRLEMVFKLHKPQIVLHAAAYKHVPLMEENPCEAVLVNTIGTRYVGDMAVKYHVDKLIMVSTDKAVNPTNVMGASKRLAEIYVQSLGYAIEEKKVKGHTQFITTRFGNVLGSNGSVIPLFKEQIEKGGPITVTHPDIIRYFMTIPEACNLVLETATMGNGNEIFTFEMGEAVKIVDLAKKMIELSGYIPDEEIKIKFTGLRPGEKLYEELLGCEEGTIPTYHEKINIAKVRKYEYAQIKDAFDTLEKLSRSIEIEETVRLMKQLLPEYKSQNSKFEVFDSE